MGTTTEQLMQDISARLTAMQASTDEAKTAATEAKDAVSEANLRTMLETYFNDLDDNDPLVRKIRFGRDGDKKLVGSKFSRWGLTTAEIELLYDLQMGARAAGFSGPSEELTNAFKAVSDAYYLSEDDIREIDRRALDDLYPRVPKVDRRGLNREQWVEAQMRAMDSQESGFGQQLIGAQYVGDLWDVSRNLGVIAPLIRTFEMTAPTAYLPVEAGFPEMLFVGESVANNSSEYTTVKTPSQRVQVDAKKFVIHQMWSDELEEDSIIPFVPFLRAQSARALAHYSDSAVLNGDTTTGGAQINTSSDPAGSEKHFLAFDGIRHAALVDNTANGINNSGNGVDLDLFRRLRQAMRDEARVTDWGHPVNRSDLVFIADPDTADAIDLMDEVVNAKLMSGNSADLLNGQTANILGHPVIRTMAQRKTLATGFVHASTGNNFGALTALNKDGAVIGWRRRVRVEVERLPARGQTRIVYSLRKGLGRFTPTGAASGIEWTATAYNIAV